MTMKDKQPNNPLQKNYNEQGNLFVFILLGVILFAALAMTFTRGAQSVNTGKLSKKQAQMIAQQMIDYSNKVAHRVDYLLSKGCSETQFNFNAPPTATNYTNTNAPTDGSCDVFTKLRPLDPFEIGGTTQAITTGSESSMENWTFRAYAVAPMGVGPTDTEKADLTLWTYYVRDEVCLAINNILGIENPSDGKPPRDTDFDWGGNLYNGTINVAYWVRLADSTGGEINGKESACFFDNDGGNERNYFYRVLIPE